jgi:hypothetical protein
MCLKYSDIVNVRVNKLPCVKLKTTSVTVQIIFEVLRVMTEE